ncbi:flagellar basal-body rod modification protein FlgD [Roseivivax halotolerans]|uniref:Basal-body rod modification protein FlgD n=1 Tax=Roseivivax halotolerans TaxID=93684 RepID=A0A1I5VGF0_9RHOB|nr:flagellar hook capping FlgD N-terminal domain-containing protein [Roseivivax halotolerans]SFQ06628.1 flagellar basal-body rod modification protein FlgD [Roseivivax halotolerans]
MYVSEISAASAGVATTLPASGDSGVLSSDFQTFLKMLVTQAENQDPLNPIDSSDYAAQLASFATVEQQVMTNDLLRVLTAQSGGAAGLDMGDWIGSEVLVSGPVFYEGDPILVQPRPAPNATSAQLTVRNEQSEIVDIVALSIPMHSIEWPTSANSANIPSGYYTFEVESFSGGQLLDTGAAQAYASVTSVHGKAGDVTLELAGGSEVAAASVEEMRITE